MPQIDSNRSIQDYFQFGANLIRQAGQYKKSQDLENAYINLKAFELLIQRLAKHPQVSSNKDEYNYNVEVSVIDASCFMFILH